MENIKFSALWSIAKMLYSTVLRDLLVKAIESPDNDWDDILLNIIDGAFQYEA